MSKKFSQFAFLMWVNLFQFALRQNCNSSLSDRNIIVLKVHMSSWTPCPLSMSTSKSQLLHPEDGGIMILQNAGILTHHCMASDPRRPWLEWGLSLEYGFSVNSFDYTNVIIYRKYVCSWSTWRKKSRETVLWWAWSTTLLTNFAQVPAAPKYQDITQNNVSSWEAVNLYKNSDSTDTKIGFHH
jgi:hypothetical protein